MPWRRSGKQEQASPLKSKVQQDAALQTKLNEVRSLLYESGHEVRSRFLSLRAGGSAVLSRWHDGGRPGGPHQEARRNHIQGARQQQECRSG